jgi:hypothetical protein
MLAAARHSYPDVTVNLYAFLCELSEDEESEIFGEHAFVHPSELVGFSLLPPDREIARVLFPCSTTGSFA